MMNDTFLDDARSRSKECLVKKEIICNNNIIMNIEAHIVDKCIHWYISTNIPFYNVF